MRVRFEPAPSGELHLGSIHTALFNWLLARHHGGTYVLRIADTDADRAKAEHIEAIYRDLRWVGLHWDEGPDVGGPCGPYLASERREIYAAAVEKLLASGAAYRCYCTQEELGARGVERGYDGFCRNAPEQDRENTVRVRMPDGDIVWHDELIGDVRVPADEIFDQRIARADGSPLYVLAVVVDDGEMGITHIIRGADIISTTAIHAVLFPALGYPMPKIAHKGLLMGPDGRRLGKRHGSTSTDLFRQEGFLPEAVLNYMALLGWSSPSGDEILDLDRIIDEFDLDRVSNANIVFDHAKLRWVNQQHIMRMPHDELIARIRELYADIAVEEVVRRGILQQRIEVLSQVPDMVRYLSVAPAPEPTDAPDYVKAALNAIEPLEDWDADPIRDAVFAVFEQREINKRKGTKPLYLAISGAPASLPVFDSMAIIGKDETLRRLRAVL